LFIARLTGSVTISCGEARYCCCPCCCVADGEGDVTMRTLLLPLDRVFEPELSVDWRAPLPGAPPAESSLRRDTLSLTGGEGTRPRDDEGLCVNRPPFPSTDARTGETAFGGDAARGGSCGGGAPRESVGLRCGASTVCASIDVWRPPAVEMLLLRSVIGVNGCLSGVGASPKVSGGSCGLESGCEARGELFCGVLGFPKLFIGGRSGGPSARCCGPPNPGDPGDRVGSF
jgi:hypothetical protein